MSKDDKSLSHTRWNCKYHIVFPKNIEEKQSMVNDFSQFRTWSAQNKKTARFYAWLEPL